MNWLKDNGAKFNKLEYPVCFTSSGLLMGVAATEDIEIGEKYLEFPENLVINRKRIRET